MSKTIIQEQNNELHDTEENKEKKPTNEFLTSKEIDQLMNTIVSGNKEPDPIDIFIENAKKEFPYINPEKLKEFIKTSQDEHKNFIRKINRTIEIIFDRLVFTIEDTLKKHISTVKNIHIEVANAEIITMRDFMNCLVQPFILHCFKTPFLQGYFLIEYSNNIYRTILNHKSCGNYIFDGKCFRNGGFSEVDKMFSNIFKSISEDVIKNTFSKMFEIAEFEEKFEMENFHVRNSDSYHSDMKLMPMGEELIVVTFNINITDNNDQITEGLLNFCLPESFLKKYSKKLSNTDNFTNWWKED